VTWGEKLVLARYFFSVTLDCSQEGFVIATNEIANAYVQENIQYAIDRGVGALADLDSQGREGGCVLDLTFTGKVGVGRNGTAANLQFQMFWAGTATTAIAGGWPSLLIGASVYGEDALANKINAEYESEIKLEATVTCANGQPTGSWKGDAQVEGGKGVMAWHRGPK